MKKSIWIVLPVVIIAVVLVAVFVGQRNSLSDQLTQLQAERSDLSRQLSEADIAAKTAQELAESSRAAMEEKVQEAETKIQEAESKILEAESKVQEAEDRAQNAEGRIQEAEGKAQEAVEALSVATTERDTLQANANTAAEQLSASIKQVQDALTVLGVSQDDNSDELEQTKALLTAVNAELAALKSESEEQAAQAAVELKQVQDALAVVTSERDQLQATAEAAANQALELQNLQSALTAMTAERDALQSSATKTAVRILNADGDVAASFDNIADLKLDDLTLEPGTYTIRILFVSGAGEVIGSCDLPYTVAAAE